MSDLTQPSPNGGLGPSSTPKSLTFPDGSLKTPRTETFPHSHFLDAWATPLLNGQHTPVQTPALALSTPLDRPLSSYSQPVRSPEDPDFHVNHFAPQNLPLPPVDVSRRLSSSPDPNQLRKAGVIPSQAHLGGSRPATMDFSHMQTPPPTRDASSRRDGQQSAGNGVATPATVIHRTPNQMPPSEALFDQTPFGFANLQYTPDMMQFPGHGPMSAPPMPQSRLFWDPNNDGMQMDLDGHMGVGAFAATPQRMGQDVNWQGIHPSATNMMQTPGFQSFQASPGPMTFSNCHMDQRQISRHGSFASTTTGVDPNMLFSFSHPDMTASFGAMPQPSSMDISSRQPYETQLRDAQAEREMAKIARSQHSRSNTNSSCGSAENARPVLQRSNTDSGMRKSRAPPVESRIAIPANASTIPRRSSPLKRQSGGSLKSIPEIRRPRTRLFIDETGRARTETVPVKGDDETPKAVRQSSQQDLRRQYPGLYEADDSDSEEDEPAAVISRKTSFTIPQPERRAPKYAKMGSDSLERSNSFKMVRSASRPPLGSFENPSSENLRPVRRSVTDNVTRRTNMVDHPISIKGHRESEDHQMPDSPGDALGALKKVVGARQQRIERASQNTLKAHNQRWAAASAAEFSNATTPHGHGQYDPFSNSFNGSATTTPSTDRSSLSSEGTRCICNGIVDDDNKLMVQCESCNKWLHMGCVGLNKGSLPPVYVCVFCTGQTPVARSGRLRGAPVTLDSPLTHKALFRR
ncbi:zinc ion binding [Stemphylium lycopersici]|nr:zinc ion binding [Stemphylium lycopersici]